ncbi:hypothetical protein Tco_1124006 [Tanacetum coccineum]|uniref:Uncharacterized protein n=1 Tax=Tanacetum coccineum TaxID=301880 RepID=A0ABQ5J5J2_9ASTR
MPRPPTCTKMELTLEQTQQGVSYEVSNHVSTMNLNIYVLERFNTKTGHHCQEAFFLIESIWITGYLKMVVEVPDSS